jgi:hypothetical protein
VAAPADTAVTSPVPKEKLRNELLDGEVFETLLEAQILHVRSFQSRLRRAYGPCSLLGQLARIRFCAHLQTNHAELAQRVDT